MNAQNLQQYRGLLFSVAYRMLGVAVEAEDLVQDTFLRVLSKDSSQINNLKNYLLRAITNASINRYEQLKRERENYVGVWLPQPILSESKNEETELSIGLLYTMEQLNPIERAVFLLHNIFDFDYELVAQLVDRSVVNCRKICSRAKQKLASGDKHLHYDSNQHNQVIDSILKAFQQGTYHEMIAFLQQDIIAYSDGGGKVKASLRPIYGLDQVTRFYFGLLNKFGGPDLSFEKIYLNGHSGLAIYRSGILDTVIAYNILNGKIVSTFQVRNPDKLIFLKK